MQAAFLVGPQTFELRHVPDPVAPPNGLVLKVKACGVCGSDLRRWREGTAPPQGITPGHEVAGEVVEVGNQVTRYRVGDRLALAPDVHCGLCYYCQRGMFNLCDDLRMIGITPGYPGGFAEKMVLSGAVLTNGIVHPMPADLPFEIAALAEPLSSVLAGHKKTNTSLDDVVVIIGAGPIGCLLVAVAKAQGAFVIVAQRSARRRELVQRFNPDVVLDSSHENIVTRVREITGGLGADIIICANPVAATQAQGVEMVRKGGVVVLFGGLPKSNPMTTLDGNIIHYGEVAVMGAFSYHPTMHALALDLLHRKLIPGEKLITHTFPLAQIDAAFETAATGQGLKVLVTP